MKEINDLQIGKAGEYMVCADLILKGYVAYPSEQGLHYDVVVDVKGRLIKIQVKTTREHRFVPQRKKQIPSYLFNCRRCGKGGRHAYKNEDLNIMAFVCLKDKLIGYLPIEKVPTTFHLRSRLYEYFGHKTGIYIEDLIFEKALNNS